MEPNPQGRPRDPRRPSSLIVPLIYLSSFVAGIWLLVWLSLWPSARARASACAAAGRAAAC